MSIYDGALPESSTTIAKASESQAGIWFDWTCELRAAHRTLFRLKVACRHPQRKVLLDLALKAIEAESKDAMNNFIGHLSNANEFETFAEGWLVRGGTEGTQAGVSTAVPRQILNAEGNHLGNQTSHQESTS